MNQHFRGSLGQAKLRTTARRTATATTTTTAGSGVSASLLPQQPATAAVVAATAASVQLGSSKRRVPVVLRNLGGYRTSYFLEVAFGIFEIKIRFQPTIEVLRAIFREFPSSPTFVISVDIITNATTTTTTTTTMLKDSTLKILPKER